MEAFAQFKNQIEGIFRRNSQNELTKYISLFDKRFEELMRDKNLREGWNYHEQILRLLSYNLHDIFSGIDRELDSLLSANEQHPGSIYLPGGVQELIKDQQKHNRHYLGDYSGNDLPDILWLLGVKKRRSPEALLETLSLISIGEKASLSDYFTTQDFEKLGNFPFRVNDPTHKDFPACFFPYPPNKQDSPPELYIVLRKYPNYTFRCDVNLGINPTLLKDYIIDRVAQRRGKNSPLVQQLRGL
jgi:hypothetical protein